MWDLFFRSYSNCHYLPGVWLICRGRPQPSAARRRWRRSWRSVQPLPALLWSLSICSSSSPRRRQSRWEEGVNLWTRKKQESQSCCWIQTIQKKRELNAPVRGRVKVFPGCWLVEVRPGVRCRARQWNRGWSLPIASPSSCPRPAAIFELPVFRRRRLAPPLLPVAPHLLSLLPILLSSFALLLLGLPVADWLLEESWIQVKLSNLNSSRFGAFNNYRGHKAKSGWKSRTLSAPCQRSKEVLFWLLVSCASACFQ